MRASTSAADLISGDDPMARKRRVAVLISGRGSNLHALIDATKAENYPAEIAVVISDRPKAAGLGYARTALIDAISIDPMDFGEHREAFEREVQRELEDRAIELVCLAGFMRVLAPWFVQGWYGRMLNIHPSLLPSFKGLNTHAAALQAGVRIHGATVHFVVPEIDSGPIICQAAVPVADDDTPDTLAARVLTVEHRLYPMALRLLAEGCLRVEGGGCRIDRAAAPDDFLIVPREQ